MQDIHQLRETLKAILDSQSQAVLATQGDNGPYGSLVAFAATADLKGLVFATTRASRKYANLVKNRGAEAIVEHMRLVRASLWSDAALLYRRELGLDVDSSSMAVIVQELVRGERSGVAFSRDPNNENRAVVEAVHGLNQGLVDGTVEPDRWLLERASGRIISHTPVVRENRVFAEERGVATGPLPPALRRQPPLDGREVLAVYGLLRNAEQFMASGSSALPITTPSGRTTLMSS